MLKSLEVTKTYLSNRTMNHLKVITATFGLSAALVTTTLWSYSKAEVNNRNPENLEAITFH